MHRVIGQNEIQSTWSKMLGSGQIPHAMVLSGDDGYGGLSLAINFVGALLCQKPIDSTDTSSTVPPLKSCGHCSSCKKVSEMSHPDLHVAFPMISSARKEYGQAARGILNTMLHKNPYLSVDTFLSHFKGGKTVAGTISADDVKQILSNLTLSSFAGGWKVQIIWHAEQLDNGPTKESNKLLKLLEEPPPKTLFILITPNHNLLLTTTLSRCQLFRLKPVPYEEMKLLADGHLQDLPIPTENQWKMAQQIPGQAFGNKDDFDQISEAEQMAKELIECLLQVPGPAHTKRLETLTKNLSSSTITLQHKTLHCAVHFVEDYHHVDRVIQGELASILSRLDQELGQSIRLSTRIMGLWLNLHQQFKL